MKLIAEFARVAATRPNKVALITEKSQMTFDDLLQFVQLLDIELTSRGVRPGQVIVLTTSRAEFVIAFALLLSLRSLTVIFSRPDVIAHNAVAYDWIIGTDAAPGVVADRQIVMDAGWFAPLGTIPTPNYLDVAVPDGQLVFQTSGSTGVPKLVVTSEAARLADLREHSSYSSAALVLQRSMATHSPAVGTAMSFNLATLLAGGSVVSLSAARNRVLAFVDMHRVDTLVTPVAILRQILEVENPGQYLGSLRQVEFHMASGDSPLIAAFRKLTPAAVTLRFGGSEIGLVARAVLDPDRQYRPGYMGEMVREDLEVGFFDDNRQRLAEADAGVIGFRPREGGFSRGYYAGEPDSQSGFHDGWFFPGDVMRIEGKSLYLTGRVTNIVNLGGNKVSLEVIGELLAAAFPDTAIVPMALTAADGVEELAVAYCGPREISAAELAAGLGATRPWLKVARAMQVTDLPLTDNGKYDVPALRRAFAPGP